MKTPDNQADVRSPFAQRRNVNREHAQAVEEIGVENLAGLHRVLRQTARHNQAAVDGYPLIFTGGLKTRGGSGSPVRAVALV